MPVPVYLREADVDALVSPADAVEAAEAWFARVARGSVNGAGRTRIALERGELSVSAAADAELGVAGVESSVSFRDGGVRSAVLVYASDRPELLGIVEAERLGRLCAGAASAVAARRLVRSGARTLGLLGCGANAAAQVECLRVALPGLEHLVAYCRTAERLADFCRRFGAEEAEYGRGAAEQDVVVTATSSRDPVLRGDWLRPGALVCAAGATRREARELDNVVLERATFVCCDSLAQAGLEAGDLVEPVERGVLEWLEVHELPEVVAGLVEGRQADADIVVFKSVGIAAGAVALAELALARARLRGIGQDLASASGG